MEAGEAADEPERKETVYDQNQRERRVLDRFPGSSVTSVHEKMYVQRRHCKYISTQNRRRRQKYEEITIVSLQKTKIRVLVKHKNCGRRRRRRDYQSNALANPRAVMIEAFDAVIADGAM